MCDVHFYYDCVDVGLDFAIMMGEMCVELGYMIHTTHPSKLENDMITRDVNTKVMESIFGSLADWYYSKTSNSMRNIDSLSSYDIEYLEFLEDKYVEINNYVGIDE